MQSVQTRWALLLSMWLNGLWSPGAVADEQLENQGARGEGILEGEPGKYNHQAIYHLRTRRFVFQRKSTVMPLAVVNQGGADRKRFATLAKWLPFLPVFGGGVVRFQYVSILHPTIRLLMLDRCMLVISLEQWRSAVGTTSR